MALPHVDLDIVPFYSPIGMGVRAGTIFFRGSQSRVLCHDLAATSASSPGSTARGEAGAEEAGRADLATRETGTTLRSSGHRRRRPVGRQPFALDRRALSCATRAAATCSSRRSKAPRSPSSTS